MFPKNSRRPLTLDHKIRLKKQRSKALKSAGYSSTTTTETETENSSAKRVHQNFKPRPADKIIKKLQNEKAERSLIQNEKEILFQERQEERTKSLDRRRQQNKKLSTKNRRGQPNLNNQIEHLLGKIVVKK